MREDGGEARNQGRQLERSEVDGLFSTRWERGHMGAKRGAADSPVLACVCRCDGCGDEEGPLFWVQLKVEIRASWTLWKR